MRAGNGLQLKAVTIDRLDDSLRIIARIDTDGAPGFLAADNARVLLKGGDSDLFDNHFKIVSGQ